VVVQLDEVALPGRAGVAPAAVDLADHHLRMRGADAAGQQQSQRQPAREPVHRDTPLVRMVLGSGRPPAANADSAAARWQAHDAARRGGIPAKLNRWPSTTTNARSRTASTPTCPGA